MNENKKIRIEKECFENGYQAFLNELGKNMPSSKASRGEFNLTFEQISHGSYRIVNRDTGRFHNPEFGIDWVV